MCLATVGEGGKPSARFVLMKGYDERGVTWYTNYNRCVRNLLCFIVLSRRCLFSSYRWLWCIYVASKLRTRSVCCATTPTAGRVAWLVQGMPTLRPAFEYRASSLHLSFSSVPLVSPIPGGLVDPGSRKAQELKAFPHAAITFWWGALHRSVRFEGEVSMVSEAESDEYFNCRPTGSKVGTVAARRTKWSKMYFCPVRVLLAQYRKGPSSQRLDHRRPTLHPERSRELEPILHDSQTGRDVVLSLICPPPALRVLRLAPGCRTRASRSHRGTR